MINDATDALSMLFKRIEGYFHRPQPSSPPGMDANAGAQDFVQSLGSSPAPWEVPSGLPPGGGVLLPEDVHASARPSGTIGAPPDEMERIARRRDLMNLGLAALQASSAQPDRLASGYMPSFQNTTPTGFTELMRLTQLPSQSVQLAGLRY